MLKEHKVALAEEVDLKTITNQLEKEELERHQQRVKEISASAAEAQLFYSCLQDHNATEVNVIARAYIKTWAATYGVDLEAVQRRREEGEKLHKELMASAEEDTKKKGKE